MVLAKVSYGIQLDPRELACFQEHTARTVPRPGGYPEVVALTGRQGGKTQFASAIVAYEALKAKREPGKPAPYALIVAQDLRSATRASFAYIQEAFDSVGELRNSVATTRAESLELTTGVTVAVYPCRAASVRGIRAAVVCLDELAFFQSGEGRAVDTEMLRAIRPTLATTGGKLFVTSSPYGQSGALYDLHRRHYGRDDSTTLCWVATAMAMNPTLSKDYLRRMEVDDPEAYRSEVLGEFRPGLSTLLDPESIAACVADGVRERVPVPGSRYCAFADPAGGSGADSFTIAIAHLDGDRAVLDVVRAWSPPFNPSEAIDEAANLLRRYGLTECVGDRYGAGFNLEAFRNANIVYTPSERTRSELYLEFLPAVNSGSVVLLDDAETLRELRGLERRRGPSGRDRVDHRPGAHDDRGNSAAGALVLALDLATYSGISVFDYETGEPVSGWDERGNEWRNRQPWNGLFPAELDSKGRIRAHPARFVDGQLVAYVPAVGGSNN